MDLDLLEYEDNRVFWKSFITTLYISLSCLSAVFFLIFFSSRDMISAYFLSLLFEPRSLSESDCPEDADSLSELYSSLSLDFTELPLSESLSSEFSSSDSLLLLCFLAFL